MQKKKQSLKLPCEREALAGSPRVRPKLKVDQNPTCAAMGPTVGTTMQARGKIPTNFDPSPSAPLVDLEKGRVHLHGQKAVKRRVTCF